MDTQEVVADKVVAGGVRHERFRLRLPRGGLIQLTQLLPFIGYPRTLNALRVVDEVTAGAATPNSKEIS